MGTVTNITKQTKDTIPDIDLLRQVALIMEKGNLDLNHFASSIRLKNIFDRLDLREENVESLIGEINLHCFRN